MGPSAGNEGGGVFLIVPWESLEEAVEKIVGNPVVYDLETDTVVRSDENIDSDFNVVKIKSEYYAMLEYKF